MDVYLLDGTYELFRHFFAVPPHLDRDGRDVGATRGVLASVIGMLESGTIYLGVATDHVIESFRNDLWPTYKTSAGMDPVLLGQFPVLEEALDALGVMLWPMIELEADDALGAAAQTLDGLSWVDRVLICTPDKDLAQCVRGTRVVQLDRRFRRITDEDGVVAKFGVLPSSIPDYLALVGDSADGFPGLPGWGAKSAAMVLARYQHIDQIPPDARTWEIDGRGARFDKLAAVLRENMDHALLFRLLATLRTDEAVLPDPEKLRWTGPTAAFVETCQRLNSLDLSERALRVAARSA